MKLEDQVTSLELSKKLKELGVKQKSLFFYAKSPENKFRLYPLFFDPETSEEVKINEKEKEYSAFTASELGELLPYQIDGAWLWLQKDPPIQGGWAIVYSKNVEFDNPLCIERGDGDTEVNVRAKMLIYLLENSLITL